MAQLCFLSGHSITEQRTTSFFRRSTALDAYLHTFFDSAAFEELFNSIHKFFCFFQKHESPGLLQLSTGLSGRSAFIMDCGRFMDGFKKTAENDRQFVFISDNAGLKNRTQAFHLSTEYPSQSSAGLDHIKDPR